MRSKNGFPFSLNSENSEAQKTEIVSNMGTFKRSLSNAKESSSSRNWTQTLGRPNFKKLVSDLTGKKFSGGGVNEERTNVSNNPHPQENISFVKTLKRNVSIRLVNLKKPEEINKCLEKAKKSFQASEYKESKELFENLLGSKHLDTLEKKSEVSLYLAAIYLLEQNGSKANDYLDGSKTKVDPFLKLVMGSHAQHLMNQHTKSLVNPEYKDVPFSKADFYKDLSESVSIDEKAIAKKLLESFGKNTPT